MKIGILLTCYNRPSYLRQTLWCLDRLILPDDYEILIVDDASTDNETRYLITDFASRNLCGFHMKDSNDGIKKSLRYGFECLFLTQCDLVINFDSDCLIRPDAITLLAGNYKSGKILTGFHSTTKNANGTDRHKITEETKYFYYKQSVGGINFCIDKTAYEKFVKPALLSPGNWDHNACINAGGVYCLKESVVEHIGFDSSMNHTEQPDVADSFYYWNLSDVTLLCVDNQPDRIHSALKACTKYIKFGDIKLLHPDIRSKEAYSKYLITEAHKHVTTSHCLVFQHDGFVNNWQAWSDDWLQYDYIGAPWHYQDGLDVGNGGFSLRSKRLMEACSKIMEIYHPEDHHVCRTYRKQLESMEFKFAPREVAEKFAFEGYLQPDKILKDQFGVHGSNPRREVQKPQVITKHKYVIGQFASLGDILWLVPLVRALMAEGNSCLWPVNPEYLILRKHFPDINFVNKNDFDLPYDYRLQTNTIWGRWLPYRYASENMGLTLRNCMDAKYRLWGHDWKIFRQLQWKRDLLAEQTIVNQVCPKGKYILVNRKFGAQGQFQITPTVDSDLPIVEMSPINGFSMLDWGMVIENAAEIHSANTSILYMLEQMSNLKMPIHLYSRNGLWGEKAFEYTEFIHSKPYILHK